MRVGEPMTDHRRAPALGEHTRAVLAELCGYPPERIDELIASGAAGDGGAATD